MKTVYKYQLNDLAPQRVSFRIPERITIDLPKGATILDVQVQDGVPCLWALIHTDAPTEPLHLKVQTTGGHFVLSHYRFIATVQVECWGSSNRSLVLHVFEDCLPSANAENSVTEKTAEESANTK